MRTRTIPTFALVATLMALTTACGPDDTKSDDTNASAPTTSSTTKTDPSQPGSPQTTKPSSNGHDYVCSRLTADEVSAALGKPFQSIAPDRSKKLLPGMQTCNYAFLNDKTIWIGIDYTDSRFNTYQKNAAKTDVYRPLSEAGENVITGHGANGDDYHLLDGDHTISVYDVGTVNRGGISKNSFNKLLRTLRGQIN